MEEIQQYLEERVLARINWYDKRSQRAKRIHLLLEYSAIIGSIGLMLLLHIEDIPRLVLAGVATVVTLSVALERVGKFGELWMTYRLMAEALESETHLFEQRAGPYLQQVNASQHFVERTEGLLSREAISWGRLMENRKSTGALGE